MSEDDERRRRLHLVNVLEALQFELYRVRHLPRDGEASAIWTACITLVEDALMVEDTHDRKTSRRL